MKAYQGNLFDLIMRLQQLMQTDNFQLIEFQDDEDMTCIQLEFRTYDYDWPTTGRTTEYVCNLCVALHDGIARLLWWRTRLIFATDDPSQDVEYALMDDGDYDPEEIYSLSLDVSDILYLVENRPLPVPPYHFIRTGGQL